MAGAFDDEEPLFALGVFVFGLFGAALAPESFDESFQSSLAASQQITKDDCKNGGWQTYGFSSQGLCVAFIASGEGVFLSPLSAAYWPSVWSEEFLSGGAEAWFCARPKPVSVSASTPMEKKRIAERMMYTFTLGPDLPF